MGHRARAVLASPSVARCSSTSTARCSAWRRPPTAVYVPAGLVPLLDGVVRGLGGAAAVLTGRRIADADRLFSPLELRRLGRARHGAARGARRPDRHAGPPIPASVVQAMNNIAGIAAGILVEQKGCGVAVHYRNAPLAQRALESEVAAIVAASSYDLVLREGRKVLEAVPRGYSKGTALPACRAAAVQGAPPRHDRRRRRR